MGRKILLDGKITDLEYVRISPESPALNYGCGLFETILYENGKIFFLEDHIERLNSSCTELGIPKPVKDSIKEKLISELVEHNNLKEKPVRIKIMFAPLFKENEWITAVFCNPYERDMNPVKAVVCTESRENPFHRHKTTSYMQNIILLEKNKGYDEVLFTNIEEKITEGTRSNIIGVKDNALYFVDTDESYLYGIMQKNILNDYKKLGFKSAVPVKNGFPIDFIKSLDELIMTNSLAVARNISSVTLNNDVITVPAGSTSEKIREFYLSE